MSLSEIFRVVTGTAPSTASTAVVGSALEGLGKWQVIGVTARFAGNTGGTLDVYVQRFDPMLNLWVDWIHFPQALSAASTATYFVNACVPTAGIYAVGTGTSPTLTANTYTGGWPGDSVRVVAVSGSNTSAGATVTVSFTGIA